MVFREIIFEDKSRYFPWKISSNELQPNILLMCKMLIILLLLNGFLLKINDPYLPFISGFDFFNNYPGIFKNMLRSGFIFFGILLIINVKTKISSFILGLIIILTLLASKPEFRNHIFIVGCVLFLVGLSKNKGLPWLIIIQISLVYIGASLNKALQMDWWTGQFMHNWLGVVRENDIYNYLSSMLPDLWFAKILSWSAIAVELIIGVSFLTKKFRVVGIWLMIVFHFAMFTMLVFRFGHFVQDIFIVLIAFVIWPLEKLTINYNRNKSIILRQLIRFLDWDNLLNWNEVTKDINNSYVRTENKPSSLIFLLLYCEGFYVFLFIFDYVTIKLMDFAESSFSKILIHLLFSMIIWGLILLFLLISLKPKFLNLKKMKAVKGES